MDVLGCIRIHVHRWLGHILTGARVKEVIEGRMDGGKRKADLDDIKTN